MSNASQARIRWLDAPALVLFIVLAAVVLLQFLSRSVLNDSVAWTAEVARYLLVGVAYAGSISALGRGEHIFLEVVYRRVALANIKPLAVLVDVVSVVFHAVLTWLAAGLAVEADRRMISIDLPKSLLYGFVALALAVATLLALRQLFERARQSGEDILREIVQSSTGEETS